ncbi:hypothetical protein Dform_00351 [Dehalogenimonas formicexedens]|uniref:Uncharacterized protein n=1 Tax=Dehalogenimonas formicexedens TaxID=1839801 RepID=A0A1P8F5F8_9CHLR|nr:hypothetical protein Dform_00351 [Dehalogenimonas formicexedens]
MTDDRGKEEILAEWFKQIFRCAKMECLNQPVWASPDVINRNNGYTCVLNEFLKQFEAITRFAVQVEQHQVCFFKPRFSVF